MKARAHITVSGRVQGVYYRSYACDEARVLGITGWVRNIKGGRVEAVLEGDEQALREMVDWCWRGPPSSRVVEVEVEWEEPSGEFTDFSVTYGYWGER
jgi:acylphosphatase